MAHWPQLADDGHPKSSSATADRQVHVGLFTQVHALKITYLKSKKNKCPLLKRCFFFYSSHHKRKCFRTLQPGLCTKLGPLFVSGLPKLICPWNSVVCYIMHLHCALRLTPPMCDEVISHCIQRVTSWMGKELVVGREDKYLFWDENIYSK